MTLLLKAFFPPLHNPQELAPAAPQGVGSLCDCVFVCVCIYFRQEARGSQSMYSVQYPWEGAVHWIFIFLQGQHDTCSQTYSR